VVNYYLEQLKEMGFIQRDGRVSRGIRLVKSLAEAGIASTTVTSAIRQTAQSVRQTVEDMLRIPVVGRIFAAEPVPVPSSDFPYYDSETMVEVARSMLPRREKGAELFALEVKGDSMIDAMVNDGDLIIMKPAREARNGDMVAVWLTDREETTLKYFYLENGQVRLQPANPTMKPIYIEDPSTVQIQSKVVMVIRQVPGLAA